MGLENRVIKITDQCIFAKKIYCYASGLDGYCNIIYKWSDLLDRDRRGSNFKTQEVTSGSIDNI